jgi:uncharacterized integral membrane protein
MVAFLLLLIFLFFCNKNMNVIKIKYLCAKLKYGSIMDDDPLTTLKLSYS